MKPPCIRGLKQFESGCPERPWDGDSGCYAWIEDKAVMIKDGEVRPTFFRACIDIWSHYLALGRDRNLTQNYAVMEQLKNGLLETIVDDKGKEIVRPKVNQIILNVPSRQEIENGPGKQKYLLEN